MTRQFKLFLRAPKSTPSQKTVPTYGLKDTPDNFGPQASIAEADLHSLIFVDLYA